MKILSAFDLEFNQPEGAYQKIIQVSAVRFTDGQKKSTTTRLLRLLR